MRALELNMVELRKFREAFRQEWDTLKPGVQRKVVTRFVTEIRVVGRRDLHIQYRVPFDNGGRWTGLNGCNAGRKGEPSRPADHLLGSRTTDPDGRRVTVGMMPIFTQREYDDFDARPRFDEAWDRLPVVRRIGGIGVRWLGPLVNLGHDRWIGELSGAAWGTLEACGWQAALEQGGPTGPEADEARWASWICFEMAEPRAAMMASAARRGWDR